jgi:exodeoxyribonuclease VII small subunit
MDKTMDTRPSASGAESFDAILRELNVIVERLEGEDLALEDSLQAFERGVDLSRRGQAILDAAERRVETLLRDGRTAPLEPARGSEDGGE